ncbi:hypothetical protein MPDQ_005032 [Monascus purpureus]|uniref:Uncharacterized protein n=1 Tax=Monascus purpureus TaxID=5098 RepID=A0A507QL31_MONPU|nr:hypothetical protein MPDQ_005032 [Monascus purpureus]BDD58301.1 hypothetical protein MAP00_003593 [Monascus purpureus]
MNQNTTYLLDSVRNDPSTRPPFFWHHIRPESQRWGIMEIWRNAGPATRPFFDRGITNGEYGPNWVAAWLLYSVFRSRDVRNNRNRRRGDENLSVSRRKEKGGSNTASAKEPAAKKGYYDPVRNGTL